jgi:hypothetical protein
MANVDGPREFVVLIDGGFHLFSSTNNGTPSSSQCLCEHWMGRSLPPATSSVIRSIWFRDKRLTVISSNMTYESARLE